MNPAAFAKAVYNTASDAAEARIERARAAVSTPQTMSPQQQEKDLAIELSRAALAGSRVLMPHEAAIVARQFLRALGLN